MKLKFKTREAKKKSEVKTIRREGNIPAVIYSKGEQGTPVEIDGEDFGAALRQLPKGELATTRFILTDDSGSERRVLVKDIRYHITTYNVEHLDFIELHDDVPVCVNVPIRPTGVAECAGIKLGGVCRQVIRALKVKCLPKNIPSKFEVDIRKLQMKQALRLRDITVPESVCALGSMDEVMIVIAKR